MHERSILPTSLGPVEVVAVDGERPPVLFFPGGHCTASSDCGWDLYRDAGHAVLSFSRPGYGRTEVGKLSPAAFAPLVSEVCTALGIAEVAAAVGVSCGGMQAVHVALDPELHVPRLALHSCAPSLLPYPDSRSQALLGPVIFAPPLQSLVWRSIHRMVQSDSGLRRMMALLSTRPVADWWGTLTAADVRQARALFLSMHSDRGFVLDLHEARATTADERRGALARVTCPTLVTGSRADGGVSFDHAVSLAATIPHAELLELDMPSHLFWIGPGRSHAAAEVARFLKT